VRTSEEVETEKYPSISEIQERETKKKAVILRRGVADHTLARDGHLVVVISRAVARGDD